MTLEIRLACCNMEFGQASSPDSIFAVMEAVCVTPMSVNGFNSEKRSSGVVVSCPSEDKKCISGNLCSEAVGSPSLPLIRMALTERS